MTNASGAVQYSGKEAAVELQFLLFNADLHTAVSGVMFKGGVMHFGLPEPDIMGGRWQIQIPVLVQHRRREFSHVRVVPGHQGRS